MLQKMKIRNNPQNSYPGDSYLSKKFILLMLTKEEVYVTYLIKVRSCLSRSRILTGPLLNYLMLSFI